MTEQQTLRRELGLVDAVLLGLGSIVGTGVYVSLAFVIDLAGSLTIPVIITAGLIALCNGLSSAQLAAIHPVAGGTYEYGYKFLGPWRGRLAGWMFLIAKSASAATAALGLVAVCASPLADLWMDAKPSEWSFYIGPYSSWGPSGSERDRVYTAEQIEAIFDSQLAKDRPLLLVRAYLAAAVVCVLGLLTHAGVRRANWANTLFVAVGIVPLAAFIVLIGVIPRLNGLEPYDAGMGTGQSAATAVALAFVGFTGYGRVATLGEEVRNPRRTIPRSMIVTLASSTALYTAVAWTCFAVSSDGYVSLGDRPLIAVVKLWSPEPGALFWLMTIGAVAAMLGVVLNLILGLSRVVLAMARRGDLPKLFGRVDDDGRSPGWAVLLVTLTVASIALLGGIKTSWTVSAMTVLVYYALTNWAALKVTPEDRFIPSWISAAGLAGCVFFAPFALWELLRG